MLTPIFHPNIAPHAICIGDHWSAGEPLWSMVARIGEMIAYQSYNTKSPLNGEAARWVDQNMQRLPLDPVSLFVDDAKQASPAAPPQPAKAVVATAVPVAKAVKVPVAKSRSTAHGRAGCSTNCRADGSSQATGESRARASRSRGDAGESSRTETRSTAQGRTCAAPAVPPETQPALVVECSGCKTRYRASAQRGGNGCDANDVKP